ncbi:hypothetical protein BDB00DRAFT_45104 [Zychaea mexicana]|uniref:uncharacterized protein n=1 Tax=Zychaea mexicana TaxID=64656 RepID=UPI0022FE7B2A|nr:uncharacterized protein BDB00DRAFT_45104 [Zychaea mexicana]KAI9488416.1 hypothetical protein BDB00DRAFT_45104 [Zychaea mexicana]
MICLVATPASTPPPSIIAPTAITCQQHKHRETVSKNTHPSLSLFTPTQLSPLLSEISSYLCLYTHSSLFVKRIYVLATLCPFSFFLFISKYCLSLLASHDISFWQLWLHLLLSFHILISAWDFTSWAIERHT